MPVSVPVNAGPYGDGSILHASPQMGAHPSVSPRPSSSSGMLDVTGNNGYPPGKTAPRPSYPVGFSQPISTNWPPAIGSVAEPFPPHGPDSMARRLSFFPSLGNGDSFGCGTRRVSVSRFQQPNGPQSLLSPLKTATPAGCGTQRASTGFSNRELFRHRLRNPANHMIN